MMEAPEVSVADAAPSMRTLINEPTCVVKVAPHAPPWLACDLELAQPADLVSLLLRSRRTGRLDVHDAEGTRSLFFEAGEYTGATSTHQPDRLGEVMWRRGAITLDQMLIAAEQLKEGKLFGRALLDLGFIEPQALRRALIEQAVHIFEAACLEDNGSATFFGGELNKASLRFGGRTKLLVETAVRHAEEHRLVLQRLGSLDRPCEVTKPPPKVTFTPESNELAQAMLQLATSARGQQLTGARLVEGVSLGRRAGARVLLELIDKGFLVPHKSAAEEAQQVKRLCAAINLVMAALDDSGFGVGDQVREYMESPPPAHEEALGGLSLQEPLDQAAVLQQAQFVAGGAVAVKNALQALFDHAVSAAHDTLSAELTARVEERAKALLGG